MNFGPVQKIHDARRGLDSIDQTRIGNCERRGWRGWPGFYGMGVGDGEVSGVGVADGSGVGEADSSGAGVGKALLSGFVARP